MVEVALKILCPGSQIVNMCLLIIKVSPPNHSDICLPGRAMSRLPWQAQRSPLPCTLLLCSSFGSHVLVINSPSTRDLIYLTLLQSEPPLFLHCSHSYQLSASPRWRLPRERTDKYLVQRPLVSSALFSSCVRITDHMEVLGITKDVIQHSPRLYASCASLSMSMTKFEHGGG